MVFFLSIGLLIDLGYMWANLWLVLSLWLFVAVFKTALNVLILQLMGEPPHRAFLTSLSLAQIGEFSFVLGAVALNHGVVNADIHRLVVAVAVVSLVTSPLWMHSARRLHHRAARQAATQRALLRILYIREWRLTLRLTSGLGSWLQGLVIRARARYWRWKYQREQAVNPPANDDTMAPAGEAIASGPDSDTEAPSDDKDRTGTEPDA